MTTLLAIEVSARGPASTTRKLTATFIEQWQASHADGAVTVRDLTATRLPYVDTDWMSGAFTPPDRQTPEMRAALQLSDELIAELMAADHIVIGTPMYNLSIPAMLKAYIDQIVRIGVTFTPQYEGLAKGKKATVIISSGGDFSPGTPYESLNNASGYLRQILGFIGITDVEVILASRSLAVDMGERSLDDFIGQYRGKVSAAAAA